ncbi:deacetylase [Microbispora rosea subsp. aerata]|nr:polysaccharide deacetylase family protein [Microbispora rosea]GGO04538.1 deacetylase [Microbispora rosea subsp. aerata]GIH56322.1 deacetylase [Microbispora rosea subsp. aerata]GLJ82237.1 deacetylase [Microbispora rosea subsp. aerata]
MRIGSVLLSLLLLGGCAQAGTMTVAGERQAAPPPRFGTPRHFDADLLRYRLAGTQLRLAGVRHGAPPRLPAVPPPRQVDCKRHKCVALTFDDGPAEFTGQVLDLLAAHRARATFFVLGQMITDETRGFVRRMASEGHELGNHSWDHASLAGLSPDALRRELERTQEAVLKETGVRMRLMRPPYGATNQTVDNETKQTGLAQVMWAVDTLDWLNRNPAVIAQRSAAAKPGDIVLMHDIHATTVQALPRLLDELDRKGFTYVTVSELLGDTTPGKKYTNR